MSACLCELQDLDVYLKLHGREGEKKKKTQKKTTK